jgi:putative GTP pyrophosphokinase
MNPDTLEQLVQKYRDHRHEFELFRNGIRDFFAIYPPLNDPNLPIIHSIKTRLKSESHLQEKLKRKWNPSDPITIGNLFERITDLAGVRVLHLYQDQFEEIHNAINKKVTDGDWTLVETPVANSWDPEAGDFFKKLGLKIDIRETYYTSIHYLIKSPNPNSKITCEVQVRTLFEEIWGEISHTINYPVPTDSKACKEQIKVLAKLVSTGSRLGDSIFRCHNDHGDLKSAAGNLIKEQNVSTSNGQEKIDRGASSLIKSPEESVGK